MTSESNLLGNKRIALVGAGFMGEALIKGLINSKTITPEQLIAADRRTEQLGLLAERYRVKVTEDNVEAVKDADVVLMAVKPQILDKVLEQIRPALRAEALVVSIAAGKSLAGMEALLEPGTKVVRAMPNVASIVAEGATALSGGCATNDQDVALAKAIFDAIGMSVVLDEYHLDAVTGLSGSGPAYVFMVVEALADAGVKVGLSRWDSQALASQAVLGAAKLVIESGDHPGRLKDMVCSPGGTAIAAVHALEKGGLRTTLIDAVEVATRRSRELGEESK